MNSETPGCPQRMAEVNLSRRVWVSEDEFRALACQVTRERLDDLRSQKGGCVATCPMVAIAAIQRRSRPLPEDTIQSAPHSENERCSPETRTPKQDPSQALHGGPHPNLNVIHQTQRCPHHRWIIIDISTSSAIRQSFNGVHFALR